jgi:hypothetical protein
MALGYGTRQKSEIVNMGMYWRPAWVALYVFPVYWRGWRVFSGGLLQ